MTSGITQQPLEILSLLQALHGPGQCESLFILNPCGECSLCHTNCGYCPSAPAWSVFHHIWLRSRCRPATNAGTARSVLPERPGRLPWRLPSYFTFPPYSSQALGSLSPCLLGTFFFILQDLSLLLFPSLFYSSPHHQPATASL